MNILRISPLFALGFLVACSVPGPGAAPDGMHDPHEASNRQVHEFNQNIDKRFFGGGKERAPAKPNAFRDGVQDNVTNFAGNFATPGYVVNQVMQGDLGGATRNTFRFAVNSTLGFAGLMDIASDLGVAEDETDFGETLHVWGAPEGAYQVLPIIGPSTERDTAGRVVDLFTNPLGYVLDKPERYSGTVAKLVSRAGKRRQYGATVDSVLHDSADSYAQTRIIYLQNRRFELGQDVPGGGVDPYVELYGSDDVSQ
ncbi:VacJ family lipoprotein [Primorskyibacter flagellatus]|uniref:MlaA family lipoprotein n=1 Tax=Primorskyibacter flagellatus TaxID=1387277 RepID=UPI003A951FDC